MKSANSKYKYLLIIFVIIILSILPISNYSLWIDESYSAYFASISQFSDMFNKLFFWNGSEAQMPGFIFVLWLWEKVFGHSEYALRSLNLIFYLPVFLLIYKSKENNTFKCIISFLILLSPFIWYNLNEARSTLALFSISFIILLLIRDNNAKFSSKVYLSFFIVIGCYMNMLFLFSLPGFILYDYMINYGDKIQIKNYLNEKLKTIFLLSAPFLIPILTYYLFTLKKGAGGMIETPGIGNVLFVFYEFLGFSGIGPPRNNLRMMNLEFYTADLILPMLFLLILVTAVIVKLTKLYSSKKLNYLFRNESLLIFLASFFFFFLVSYLFNFRFLGRHISFLLPYLMIFFVELFTVSEKILINNYNKIFISIIFLFWIFSSLNIRFNDRYQKDNYKGIVEYLASSTNSEKKIYFVGDQMSASYYGMNFKEFDAPISWPKVRKAILLRDSKDIHDIPKGTFLLGYSKKKDIYDPNSLIVSEMISKQMRTKVEFKDFLVYE